MEADKPGAEHDLGVQGFGDSFNQVSMSIQRHLELDPHSLVPCTLELVKLATEEIIEAGRVDAAVVDVVKVHDNIRVAEVEFLI